MQVGIFVAVASASIAWTLSLCPVASAETSEPNESTVSRDTLIASAGLAVRQCRAGDLAEASQTLQALQSSLEAHLGAGHASARRVRSYLQVVARAQGLQLPTPGDTAAESTSKVDPKLKRALRKLSVCALVKPVELDLCSGVKSRDHLRHAGDYLQRCRYEEAFQAVQCAEKTAPQELEQLRLIRSLAAPSNPSAPAGGSPGAPELFQLDLAYRRALILAQVGRQAEALTEARTGSALAVASNDPRFRIAFARMLAQLGDLQHSRGELDAVQATFAQPAGPPGGDAAVRVELETARGVLALLLGSPHDALTHLDRALAGTGETHAAQDGQPATSSPHTEGAKTSPSVVPAIAESAESAESAEPAEPTVSAVSQLPLANVQRLRGDALRLAGNFPKALEAYAEARRLFEAADRESPDHGKCGTASVVSAIGQLHLDLGDPRFPESSRGFFQQAENLFKQAEEILKAELGPDHIETITAAGNRAIAGHYLEPSPQHKLAYMESVELLCKVLPEGHRDCASGLRNWSHIELDDKNLTRAEKLLDRALESQLKLGSSHPDVAVTRLERGRLLSLQGKHDEAAAEIDRAIEVLSNARGPEHPTVIRAHTRRARNAVAQGDSATALREATEALQTLAAFTRRTFGALTERQRASLSQDSRDALGALLSISDAPAREILLTVMPHRDSVLRSINASRKAAQSTQSDRPEHKLESLRRRYAETVSEAGPQAAQRAAEIAREIDDITELSALLGAPGELKPEMVLKRACERLAANAALVKFISYDRTQQGATDSATPAYAALVVRGESCEVGHVDLGAAERVDTPAAAFGRAMREHRADEPEARAAIGAALLAPLRSLLSGTERWLVIPDGAIWGIPIGILPDPEQPDQYLLERVTVGYLTSTVELSDALLGMPIGSGKSLLIGAPEFGQSESGRGPVVLTGSGPCEIPPFEVIPATRAEIDDIAALVPSPTVLVALDATESRLAEALQDKPDLIHFATHAYFAGAGGCGSAAEHGGAEDRRATSSIGADPLMLSGIAMAGANLVSQIGAGGQDGILTSFEIAGLDLASADLVVLSACDTGTGVQLRGQEIQGLRWGFRAAGARALVTSLWRSNDAATRRMMRDFYQSLYSDKFDADAFRGAEALRSAQLSYVNKERRTGVRRPLVWANFIFSGTI